MTADNTGRSRRDFFYLAGALAVGSASGQNRVKAVEPESPQIGILLATTFTTGTLEPRLDAAKADGHGVLDYDLYMSLLRKYEFKGPILLHGLTVEQVPGCLAFVRAKLASSFQRSA